MRVHSVSKEEAEAIVCDVVDMLVCAWCSERIVDSRTLLRRRRVVSSAFRARSCGESFEEEGSWWDCGVGVCGACGWEESEGAFVWCVWCCSCVVSEIARSWKRARGSSVVVLWVLRGLRDIVVEGV